MTDLRDAIQAVEEALICYGYAGDEIVEERTQPADWDALTVSEIAVEAAAPIIEAMVRERIAQQIEAQRIDAWGSQEPRGPVTFARFEAYVRCASIARGGESDG